MAPARLGHCSATGPGFGGVGAGSESLIAGNEIGGMSGSFKILPPEERVLEVQRGEVAEGTDRAAPRERVEQGERLSLP